MVRIQRGENPNQLLSGITFTQNQPPELETDQRSLKTPVFDPPITNLITNPNAEGVSSLPATISGWRPRPQNNDNFQQVPIEAGHDPDPVKLAIHTGGSWDPFLTSAYQQSFEDQIELMVGFEGTPQWEILKTWDVQLYDYLNVFAESNASYAVYQQDAGGEDLYLPFGSPYSRRSMDLRDESYRQGWVETCREALADGAAGIFVDDVNPDQLRMFRRLDGSNPTTNFDAAAYYTSAITGQVGWPALLADFLHDVTNRVRTGTGPAGTAYPDAKFIFNMFWKQLATAWNDPRYERTIDASDYMIVEHGHSDGGLTNGPEGTPGSTFALRSQLAFVDKIHERGKNYILYADSSNEDNRAYEHAAFLSKREPGDLLCIWEEATRWPNPDPIFKREFGLRTSYIDPGTAGATIHADYEGGYTEFTPVDKTSAVFSSIAEIPPNSYNDEVVSDAPFARWKIDETTGDYLDTGTAASRPLTADAGTGTLDRNATALLGASARASRFQNGARAHRAHDVDLRLEGDFTIELWLRVGVLPSAASFPPIIRKGGGGGLGSWQLYMIGSNGNLAFKRDNIDNNLNPAQITVAGANHHIAVTYNAATQELKCYLNGALAKTVTGTVYATGTTDTSTFELGLGGGADHAIDEVALYHTALDATRIAARYDSKDTTTSPVPATIVPGQMAFRLVRDRDGTGAQSIYMDTNPDLAVVEGDWIGAACEIRKASDSPAQTGSIALHGPTAPNIAVDSRGLTDNWQRFTVVGQIPAAQTQVAVRSAVAGAIEGSAYYVRRVMAVKAATEAEAAIGIANYFDGDTEGYEWDGTPHGSTSTSSYGWVAQEFRFANTYVRGHDAGETNIPEFTGVQIFVDIEPGYAEYVGLDWQVQRYIFGTGWVTEAEGTSVQSHADGPEVWYDILFDEGIQPDAESLDDLWRFAVRGRVTPGATRQEVEYDVPRGMATIGENEVFVRLYPDRPYPFILDGVPSILLLDSADEKVYYSVQQGLNGWWFSAPNPLENVGNVKATEFSDDGTALTRSGDEFSFMFRLMGSVADEGTDFLGNNYRSAVRRNNAANVATLSAEDLDTYWLSKPNPSRFAVESIYFDITDSEGNPQVVDRVLLDPITPGVYFQIYYTDQGDPGIGVHDWEERIWNHIPKSFRMDKRETHVLPTPVTAKYMKIEFSHLQPKSYSPGDFSQPIQYKKHPRWVFDYFLARTSLDQYTEAGNNFRPRRVGITYDALDLAFNYHLDDLNQEPDAPVIIDPDLRQQVANQLAGQSVVDVADTETLRRLNLVVDRFKQHPSYATVQYLLADVTQTTLNENYSTELPDLLPQDYDVSALRNTSHEGIIYEKSHPVMFFFLPSRHRYKEVKANLTHNRAYFVGVRQVAFTRERYTVAHDNPIYVETMGDGVNMERSDFERVSDGSYAVYTDLPEPEVPVS